MKDLDFDELDRAVNSLIGSPSAPATIPAIPVANDSPAPIDTSVPVVAPVESASAVSSSPQPLVARRSSGRFMDVVHPSSDMRPTTMPDRSIAREGTTVQPVEAEPTPETTVEAPVTTEPTVPPKSSDWPDPLDFHGYKDEEVKTAAVTENAETPDKPADISSLATDELANPLESPFLPDAKVEKRPLGAFADNSTSPEEPAFVETAEQASDDSDHPIGTEMPLPAELQDNLLSIEANEDTALASEEVAPSKPQSPMVETMSIPQQYVEQPSTGDKPTSSSIFDVEAYRKPAQAKKAKSGWLMVLWIVLLIILGVGAGAAFYFYVLPLL